MTYLFDLVLLAMSVYVLVSGIRGRGRLFELDNIKEGMEEVFLKKARKLYIVLGIVMIINSASSLLLTELYTYDANYQLTVPLYDLGSWSFLTPGLIKGISYAALAGMILLLVLLGIFMSKVTDRNAPAKKKGSSASRTSGKRDTVVFPSSAFDFEEETEGVVKEESEQQDA